MHKLTKSFYIVVGTLLSVLSFSATAAGSKDAIWEKLEKKQDIKFLLDNQRVNTQEHRN